MSNDNQEIGLAPVVLFAYVRPDHLANTVRTLASNPEADMTHLFVFCDGAKKPEHQAGVDAVRQLAASIVGFAEVTVVERDRNWGLSASIIDGVTQIVGQYGRVIVVEDDLMLSPHFLRYMNDALNLYSDDDKVASVHGYCYPVEQQLPETFFLRGADCWGWGTWKRAWSRFSSNGAALLEALEQQELTQEFDYNGQYGFTRMLRDQIAGLNDSWAIRWHASCYLAELLTLYPGRSLVHNIGNDSSGTHSRKSAVFDQVLSPVPVSVERLPLEASDLARAAFTEYFRVSRGGAISKALRAIRALKRRISL